MQPLCRKTTDTYRPALSLPLCARALSPLPGGHLDFIQNMEYKFVELLSCSFVASDDETVRQSIAFRYNAVKSRLALMQARLQDINALVKIKNPSLLLRAC